MTFEDLESWQQARQLAFSLAYLIEDNYPTVAADAVELRKRAVGAAQGREKRGEWRGKIWGVGYPLHRVPQVEAGQPALCALLSTFFRLIRSPLSALLSPV